MKPAAFDYHRPDTVEDVLGLLTGGAPDVALLAGGQSLVRLMNLRTVRPSVVVDINRVAGLGHVTATADALRIGPMVRLHRIEHDPLVRERLPVLARAAALVGHPQIRSRATIGGSLCHGDPAAELPTLAVALGARLRLRSADGERTVAAEEFYHRPYTTVRRPSELLTDIEIPVPSGVVRHVEEISRRTNDLPLVVVCVALGLAGGTVATARIAAGGVAPTPVRLTAAEHALTGLAPGAPLDAVLAAAAEEADPLDVPHAPPGLRRALLRTALRRALVRLTPSEGR
ncbi:FAD binding domain-containing protein [Streptomyces sp. NPDC060035]|uniref:FAD binding domain-containing protein n=1 Tax=Streptomyces sp. NPDC060035 TaxID=3347044 RepID=UPI0036D08084